MISRNDFHHSFTDLRLFVAVSGIHQGFDAHQEMVRVEGDGLADVDLFVGRLSQTLLCKLNLIIHEYL